MDCETLFLARRQRAVELVDYGSVPFMKGFPMIVRNIVAVLALVAIGAMVASPAEAGGGGGGTKGRNGTLRVLGQQTGGNGVAVIPLATGVAAPAAGYTNIAALQAAGGAIVNPGQVVQFKVAGPGDLNCGDATVAPILMNGTKGAYSGAQNQTGYMLITGPFATPTAAGTGSKF